MHRTLQNQKGVKTMIEEVLVAILCAILMFVRYDEDTVHM